MELLYMRYFAALAETESVTKAAQQLHITPPALSKVIGRLEAELGFELFEPAGRGIRLNEKGQTFYGRIKPLLDEFDLVIKETVQRDDVGVVIGVPTAWSDMLVDFARKRPDILLRIEVDIPRNVKPYFAANEYDFWLTTTDATEYADFFDARVFCDDAIVLAVHKTHPLAGRGSVSLQELKGEKFIFPFRQYQSHDKYLQLCRQAGFEPEIILCADSSNRLGRVSRNEGVAFMECMDRESILHHDVALLNLSDLPFTSPCYICTRKGRVLPPNAQTFLNFALHYYREN